MSTLTKYAPENVLKVFQDLDKYSIGLDDWFNKVSYTTSQTNYPPYNLIRESDTKYKLEVAASGFKSSELTVYTENNQLVVEGNKESKNEEEYIYRSLSHRNFKRVWSLSDDVRVNNVVFEDGLLIVSFEKIVPDHQQKKVYF